MRVALANAVEIVAVLDGNVPVYARVHEVGVAADGVERRAELMAHRGEELALHAIGGFGFLLRALRVGGSLQEVLVRLGQLA